MRPAGALCVFLLAAVLLAAQERSWQNKPITQWTEAEARQVLSESPWARLVTPQNVRDLSPDERALGERRILFAAPSRWRASTPLPP